MTTQVPEKNLTPMMAQWAECKHAAGTAVLLFRMGDFYEAFYEDAETVARELELTLTQRQGVPMAGVPWHAGEGYIDRLVAKGLHVAIAEQMEDPKLTKGLVKRAVTRVITPGTVISSSLLSEKESNYFVSVTQVGALFGIAALDLTTGELRVCEVESEGELASEIARLRPSEFLTSDKFQEKYPTLFESAPTTAIEPWQFDHKDTSHFLTRHFQVHHLDGFGVRGMVAAINAAGALLAYVQEALSLPIRHIRTLTPYAISDALLIDKAGERNLELTSSLHEGATLLGVLDKTETAMGGRLLRKWLRAPLLSPEAIARRQDAVEVFPEVSALFRGVRDIERLMMKISAGYATPRDLVALSHSLEQVGPLKERLSRVDVALVREATEELTEEPELVTLLAKALVDEPPTRIHEGNLIREGFHATLDELRSLARDGKAWIARYQTQVREETGIKTLKVGFNRVFGYYLEVSKGQASAMPESFQRRQTLTNSERFISPELKAYESKVLSAEEKMHALEAQLFQELKESALRYETSILRTAQALATLDVLHALAAVARTHRWIRPTVDESRVLEIEEGRHPVLEELLPKGEFIPNDTRLGEKERMMLITGPNMAGKSTYIRQVALIVILAQMGSFVPARKAHVGVVDKIFTRIGAADDLTRGQSTFMVEMSETANILNNATDRSLVILDEIGRGTSTYDGVSIAWAVAEYLLTAEGRKAKTLFATHYFELTALEESLSGAVNYHAAVEECQETIVFLHKIVRGGTDRSYGIHVARLAGLPSPVITRAGEILGKLEQKSGRKQALTSPKEQQLLLFADAIR